MKKSISKNIILLVIPFFTSFLFFSIISLILKQRSADIFLFNYLPENISNTRTLLKLNFFSLNNNFGTDVLFSLYYGLFSFHSIPFIYVSDLYLFHYLSSILCLVFSTISFFVISSLDFISKNTLHKCCAAICYTLFLSITLFTSNYFFASLFYIIPLLCFFLIKSGRKLFRIFFYVFYSLFLVLSFSSMFFVILLLFFFLSFQIIRGVKEKKTIKRYILLMLISLSITLLFSFPFIFALSFFKKMVLAFSFLPPIHILYGSFQNGVCLFPVIIFSLIPLHFIVKHNKKKFKIVISIIVFACFLFLCFLSSPFIKNGNSFVNVLFVFSCFYILHFYQEIYDVFLKYKYSRIILIILYSIHILIFVFVKHPIFLDAIPVLLIEIGIMIILILSFFIKISSSSRFSPFLKTTALIMLMSFVFSISPFSIKESKAEKLEKIVLDGGDTNQFRVLFDSEAIDFCDKTSVQKYNNINSCNSFFNNGDNNPFVKNLGIDFDSKAYSTESVLSLLNVKYFVCKSPVEYFSYQSSFNDCEIRKNNNYFPFSFFASSGFLDFDYSDRRDNLFDFQNSLFSSLTGVDEPIFSKVDYSKKHDNTIVLPDSSNVYIYLNNLSKKNTTCVVCDDFSYNGIKNNAIYKLPDHSKSIKIIGDDNQETAIYIYQESLETLQKHRNAINHKSQFILKDFNGTKFESLDLDLTYKGTWSVDGFSCAFVSVIDDGKYTISHAGKKINGLKKDGFLVFEYAKGINHTIITRSIDGGTSGFTVSIIGLGMLVFIMVYLYVDKNKEYESVF